jgi:site-specific DNA-methyltransferase (adenine-specific)
MTIESTNDNNSTNPAITYSECYAQVFSRLFLGDCLIESDKIESGSVDLILTDLPYGTVKGLGTSRVAQSKNYNMHQWDETLPIDKIMQIANRILRKNGKMVLTANQPFTTQLINAQIPNLPHCYNMYWDKMHFANCMVANTAPVSYIEDILVFSKTYDTDLKHPVYDYADLLIEYIGKPKKQIFEEMGHQGAFHLLLGKNSFQVHLCTEKTYNQMIEMYGIDKMEGFINYKELKEQEDKFKEETQSTFNLWEGNKYKSNILKYKKDYNGYHPTQKPILLLEDLIKTFSNEGNLVVDLTMGSGSTGVACKNTNRSFIGIEKDEKYFKIAEQRINARTLFS